MVMRVDLTTEQEKAISELRKRLINDLPREMADDSIMLYKFLKARNFNLDLAESMLLKNLEWRKTHQIDTILTDFKPPEVCAKYMSQSFLGYSKAGGPIRYTALGNVDSKNLFKATNKQTILKASIQVIEDDFCNSRKRSEKLGYKVTQGILIINLDHLTLARATHKKTIELFIAGINAFQDNYPESVQNIYIINASVFFTYAFEAIKSFLADAVMAKIQVFCQDNYKEALLKVIDADVLPAFLGGNKTDPDGNPYCVTFLKHGGTVPKSYITPKVHLSQQGGFQKMTIDRHSKSSIEINVSSPNSVIQWQFQTKVYDIGFGLFYGGKELIPVHKIDTDIEAETGMYRCNKRGVYTLIFDNTYSWMHSKEVFYQTNVISSEKTEN